MVKILNFLLALALLSPLALAKTYKLSLASSYEKNVPIIGEAPNKFKELLELISAGAIKVRIDYPSKHKAPFAILDFVKTGQYDMGYSAGYFYKGKDAKLMFFTTIPFGMTWAEQRAWYERGGGRELALKSYAKHNIVPFYGGSIGMQMGGWFKKPINSLDDLKGLKLRMPGFGAEAMSKLGVNVVSIAPGELYLAMQTGTIDAAEWAGPAIDIATGLNKVAKYYYTGWQEPASENEFYTNKKLFDSLPQQMREYISMAAQLTAIWVYENAYYENASALAKLNSDKDIQVLTMPSEVIQALKTANDENLNAIAAKDPEFAEILASQRDFIKLVRPWSEIADQAYLNSTKDGK